MSAPVRLGAFAAFLALVFLSALVVGRAVGPLDGDDPAPRPPATTVTTLHPH